MASTFWQLEGEKVEAVIDFKFFSSKITVDSDCVCVPSHFSGVRLFVTLLTVTHQVILSMGFSRQEYWSGLPCPSCRESSIPGDETHVSYVFCVGRQVP